MRLKPDGCGILDRSRQSVPDSFGEEVRKVSGFSLHAGVMAVGGPALARRCEVLFVDERDVERVHGPGGTQSRGFNILRRHRLDRGQEGPLASGVHPPAPSPRQLQ